MGLERVAYREGTLITAAPAGGDSRLGVPACPLENAGTVPTAMLGTGAQNGPAQCPHAECPVPTAAETQADLRLPGFAL